MITEHRWTAGHTALAVGMLVSALMQIAYSWPHGWVRLIAGLAAVAVVPGGMHLWPHIPITGRWTRAWRAIAMSVIVGCAMWVNGAHGVSLLVGRGEQLPLAVMLVVAIEALMVMASLATRAHPDTAARAGGEPDLDDLELLELTDPLTPPGEPQDHPAPAALMSRLHREHTAAMQETLAAANRTHRMRLVPPAETSADPDVSPAGGTYLEQARQLLADEPLDQITPTRVAHVTGCSRATATRVLRDLRDERRKEVRA